MSAAELAESLAVEPLCLGSWSKQVQVRTGEEPSQRRYHSSIYHKSSMYVYGGLPRDQCEDAVNEQRMIYRFNVQGKCWSRTVTNFLNNNSFSFIYAHATVIYNNMMYLFGGSNYREGTLVGGLWCLNLESYNWKRQELKGYSPPPRDHAAMVLYQRSMIVLYGGRAHGNNLNDLHVYRIENKGWLQIEESNYDFRIMCRLKPALACMGDHIYLFGGERQVSEGSVTSSVLLNDFYQLRLIYRPMSTRPDVWIKEIITNSIPPPRVASFATLAERYLILWGGENIVQDERTTEAGFWLYNINEVSWNWVKIKGNVTNLPRAGFSFTGGIDKFYIFGQYGETNNGQDVSSNGSKLKASGLQTFNLQAKEIDGRFVESRSQPKITEEGTLLSCNECRENSKVLTKAKFSQFSILREVLQERLEYVFSAFGLLVDNCLLLKAKDCKVVFHHTFKEKYCLIEDNGSAHHLWGSHSDFIGDLLIFRTYVEENIDQLEEFRDEKNKTNFMKEEKDVSNILANTAKETKEQKELKDKEAKDKEEQRELRKRKDEAKKVHRKKIEDRKQFSRNIKLGSLRLGDRVIYISKFGSNSEHRRVFVIEKCESSEAVLCYRAYYYILQNNAVTEPAMEASKKYIDEEYKMYFKIANERKDNASNFLFVTNLRDIVNEGGQMEAELKESIRHNDVFCCQKRQLQSLEQGVLMESIDFSLKNYLSLLYLKSDELKMSLTISDHRTVQISNLEIFDKIDNMVKTEKIIDLEKPLDLSNCNIIEVYYNKVTSNGRARDLNRKTSTFNFLNGILFYHRNRLISRYKFNLGEVNRLFRNKVKNIQQSLIMFGFIEIKEDFTVNIFKTGFVRDDLLEQIYHRLKFVEKYAGKVTKEEEVRSRPLDEKGDRNQPRKRFKGDENNSFSNPPPNSQVIHID